jgi:hypothetical protein
MAGCLIRVILISVTLIILLSLVAKNSDYFEDEYNKAKLASDVILKIIKYKNND